MNTFFGVGPFEALLIAVLALIFIGPQRLPGVIQQVMKVVREVRSYAAEAQEQISREIEDIRPYLEDVTRDVNELARDISTQAGEIASQTQQVVNEASSSVSSSAALNYTPAAAPPGVVDVPRPEEFPALPPAPVTTNGAAPAFIDDDRPSFGDYRPG